MKQPINKVSRQPQSLRQNHRVWRPKRVKICTIQSWQVDKKGTNDPMEECEKDSFAQAIHRQACPTRWKAARTHCQAGKCKWRVTVRHHFPPLNLVKINKTDNNASWRASGERRLSNYWGRKCRLWSATASGEIKLATAIKIKYTQIFWPSHLHSRERKIYRRT